MARHKERGIGRQIGVLLQANLPVLREGLLCEAVNISQHGHPTVHDTFTIHHHGRPILCVRESSV